MRQKDCCSLAMTASAAASSSGTATTSRRASAWRGIHVATAALSVRAGAGIFYGSITGNEWNTTADNQPFTVRQSFPTVVTLSDPYRNQPGGVGPFPFEYDPASPRFTLPANVFGPSLEFVWPKTYQMNVTVEKELFRNVSASASYVGALGRNLPASIDRNYPVFGSTATTANVNARRPYQPGVLGAARVLESIFTSDYHGLQLDRGETRQPFLGQGVLLVQSRDGGSRLSGRRPACRAELQRPPRRARADIGRSHA